MPHGQVVAVMVRLPVNHKVTLLHCEYNTATVQNQMAAATRDHTLSKPHSTAVKISCSFSQQACLQHARQKDAAAAQRAQLPRVVDAAAVTNRHQAGSQQHTGCWSRNTRLASKQQQTMLHVHAPSYPYQINQLLRPGSQHRGGLLC